MYAKDDPRAALKTAGPAGGNAEAGIAAAEYVDYALLAPSVIVGDSAGWITRGQNAAITHWPRLQPGDAIFAGDASFEHVLILTAEESSLAVEWAGQDAVGVSGPAVVVVPSGAAVVRAEGTGGVLHLQQSDEAARGAALNEDSYADAHPRVALLEPWPDPVDGERVRVYRVQDHPMVPTRFGRILRTRAFMINYFDPFVGRRDPRKLSPHHHDDFEQYTVGLEGSFVHHIRTPWGTDSLQWRTDEHQLVSSPSVTIIPPPTVHTSEGVSAGVNHLIDIFSPPREDFSSQGWVINADEYPAP